MIFSNPFKLSILGGQEEWKCDQELQYTKTQRGRKMLVYNGYRYVENRQSAKNIFWRCSRYVKYGCRATVSTSKDTQNMTVRITGIAHSHEQETKFDESIEYEAKPRF